MARSISILIAFLLVFQFGRSDPFSKDSVVFVTSSSLIEYTIDGLELQTIGFPAGFSCANPCIVHMNPSGTQLVLPLISNVDGFKYHAYIMNANAQNSDITSMGTINPTLKDVVVSDTEVWFNYGDGIAYAARGSTFTTEPNIVSTSNPQITSTLLIGSRLYAYYLTNKLGLMDPVVFSGQSSFTQLLPSTATGAFTVTEDNVFVYVMEGASTVGKYTWDPNGQLTRLYGADTGVPAIYLSNMKISNTRYLIYVTQNGISCYHMVDTGSGFGAPTKIGPNGAYHSISASPTPTCGDNLKNQDETDVDCGGSTCSTRCIETQACLAGTDCVSNTCNGDNVCVPTCSDGRKNNGESDVDCGGANCDACVDGKTCQQLSDCTSSYCNPSYTCSIPSCSDGWKNTNETDVDCGGGTCPSCAPSKGCVQNSDCQSDTCTNQMCMSPPVAPVAAPVAAPVTDGPVSVTPVASLPVSTPVAKQPVSTPTRKVSLGTVASVSILGLIAAILLFN